MKDLYYGFWAQISGWEMAGRAAFIIGIIFIVIYLIFMPVLMKLFFFVLRGIDLLIKVLYCVINWGVELAMSNKNQAAKAETLNKVSGTMETCSTRICEKSKKIWGKKRISFLKFFICYCVIILAIILPEYMKNRVDERYMPYLLVVSDAYHNIEKYPLEKARHYPPLFKESKNADRAASAGAAQESEEDLSKSSEQEYLSLSKSGLNGSNVREKPDTRSKVIVTVSGDIKLSYLGRQENWIWIRLEDGTEGWINQNLLEGVPEE